MPEISKNKFIWGSRTYSMGIINVTPDSFSNDGIPNDIEKIQKKAIFFESLGTDIIDVGGESTRPPKIYGNLTPVNEDQEIKRVIPAIKAIKEVVSIPISIDSYKPIVAEKALTAGASIVNNVWATKNNDRMNSLLSEQKPVVILMHNQQHSNYVNVVDEVFNSLNHLVEKTLKLGIEPDKIIIDPGIGFGKTTQHNLTILRNLEKFKKLNQPLLIGTSRKSTIGNVLNLPTNDRIEGTAASIAISISKGADIIRVHDIKEMNRVAKMSDAIIRGWDIG
ncbi:MAG: dihydropteroate synthase [SAR202 cluster bacterium]|nr:dihydropteroate synthase [SAR202 cluster bacterium]|tara:strand:+ start:38191 stop:39027 length:837 start_codon:yes stop_codon:yes gene_type:complete